MGKDMDVTPEMAEQISAKVMKEVEQQLRQEGERMAKRYGVDELNRQTEKFTEVLDSLAARNVRMRELTAEDEAGYEREAEATVKATQDYYNYLGTIPDDLRRFFLLITETVSGGGSLDVLDDLLGAEISVDPTPLLSIQAIRPRKYVMQIDTITNHLTTLDGQTQLKVGTKGSQPVKTTVTLDMPEHMRIEGGGSLSTYDKSIINGVTSLLESGNTVFSIPMLYHAMTGKPNPTVDEQLSEEIGGKLEKMRRMILSIDLTEENRARYLTDSEGNPLKVEDLAIEGYLLPLNKMSGTVNGRPTEVYQMIQPPPLYTYSKMKRQLASAPITLLNAPVNNNSTTIPLKTYLLQRIELMKNRNNNIISNKILYETIYSELGAASANKTRKMRIRTYTTTILSYFIEQEYITGFVEYKEGRVIRGLQITL